MYQTFQEIYNRDWEISSGGGSRIRETPTPREAPTYYSANCHLELHENEEIKSEEGARVPTPPRSANSLLFNWSVNIVNIV